MAGVAIVAAARSAIGRAHKGSLQTLRADDMAVQIVNAALAQVPGLKSDELDDLLLGAAHQTGEQGQNLARRVAVLLGSDGLPGATVSRACASSLEATVMAANAIRSGAGEAYLCVGVESVSRYRKMADQADRNPRFEPHARAQLAEGGWDNPRSSGQTPDIYIDMGQTAENVATRFGVSRAEQDGYALLSQSRYAAAAQRGFWAAETTPLLTPDGHTLERDESPRPTTTLESLATLAPAFDEHGTVTAGNACPLNDGAAAVIVMDEDRARVLGYTRKGRIVASAAIGVSPEIMGIGPVDACAAVLRRAGMAMSDVDVIEINEAFAAQVLASLRGMGVEPDQVNRNGGAIALGHPFGMTGARLITSTLHALEDQDASVGMITLCVGGGMGMAVVLERA